VTTTSFVTAYMLITVIWSNFVRKRLWGWRWDRPVIRGRDCVTVMLE